MKKILLPLLFLFAINLHAQEVVLTEEPDTIETSDNPYKKFSVSPVLDFAFITGRAGGASKQIHYGRSNNLGIGLEFEKGLWKHLSVGAGLRYRLSRFVMKHHMGFGFPTGTTAYDEKLKIHEILAEPFVRLHLNRFRGPQRGLFIDLACGAGWISGGSHSYVLKDTYPLVGKTKIKHKDLDFLESFAITPTARIGLGKVAFTASYRYSNLLKDYMPDLPQYSFGLRLMMQN